MRMSLRLQQPSKISLLHLKISGLGLLLLISLGLSLYAIFQPTRTKSKAAEQKLAHHTFPLSGETQYKKGEVLVRFRPTTKVSEPFRLKVQKQKIVGDLDKNSIFYGDFDESTLPLSLVELNKTVPVKTIERIFKNISTTTNTFNIDVPRTMKITFDESIPVEQVIQTIKQRSDIVYVEKNHIITLRAGNDPYYLDRNPPAPERPTQFHTPPNPWDPPHDYQWNLKIIQNEQAWSFTQGASDIRVAIIDTGLDFTHEELQGINIIKGHNYIEQNDDPIDDYGHGTHVAGIITAKTNNAKGVAGIASNTTIIPIRVIGAFQGGTDADVAAAIIEAAITRQAPIINMSFGYNDKNPSQTEIDALTAAYNAGRILIAAAGNDDADIDSIGSFPPSFTPVIAVGATSSKDEHTIYSDYGNKLDVVAPGGYDDQTGDFNLLSLNAHRPGSTSDYLNLGDLPVGIGYLRLAGTSQAAPHVAGIAALIIDRYRQTHNGIFPTNTEVENIIKNSADDLGDYGFDKYYGYGRINAYRALSEMNTAEPVKNPPKPVAQITIPKSTDTIGLYKMFIKGSALGGDAPLLSYNMAWKRQSEGNDKYRTTGILLQRDGKQEINNGILGTFDVRGQINETTILTLQLTVVNTQGGILKQTVDFKFDPDMHRGFPLQATYFQNASRSPIPVIADLYGDGKKEIIYADDDDYFDVYDSDGNNTLRIKRTTLSPEDTDAIRIAPWSLPSVGNVVSSPTGKEIAGMYTSCAPEDINNYINKCVFVGLWANNGTMLPGWPKPVVTRSVNDFREALFPVLVDLDQDEYDDVLFLSKIVPGSTPAQLYAWKGNGTPITGFPVTIPVSQGAETTSFSAPTIGDVMGDTNPEIIFISQDSAGLIPSNTNINIYSSSGQLLKKWPITSYGESDFPHNISLADMDKDGKMEILYTDPSGIHIRKMDGTETAVLSLPDTYMASDIVLTDIVTVDGKNIPEVIGVGTKKSYQNHIYNFFTNSGTILPGSSLSTNLILIPSNGSVVTADLNADGTKELVIHDGTKLIMNSYDKTGSATQPFTPLTPFPKQYATANPHVAIADLDNDGKAEIINGPYVFNTNYGIGLSEWSQYRRDERHNNAYIIPSPPPLSNFCHLSCGNDDVCGGLHCGIPPCPPGQICAQSLQCFNTQCPDSPDCICAPTPTPNPEKQLIHYRIGFSNTQGTNSLTYLARNKVNGTFQQTTWNQTANGWKYSPADRNFIIQKNSMAPAFNYDAVVRWTATPEAGVTQTGTGRIYGYFKRCCTQTGTGSFTDLTTYKVIKNDAVLWSETVKKIDTGIMRKIDFNIGTTLSPNDKIEFWADANNDSGWDGTNVDFTITIK